MDLIQTFKVEACVPSERILLSGNLVRESEVFLDHFPRFPVLPGVMMIEMMRFAVKCYLERTGKIASEFKIDQVEQVKFSQLLKPGDVWEMEMQMIQEAPYALAWKGRLSSQGKTVASGKISGQLVLAA